tara:strand:- start:1322 stop:1876 length:555 start_codon:yes stop_codon:yes gene_type:complete
MENRISFKYGLVIALVVGLSWFIHELAHWVVASIVFGYESAITLNTVYLVDDTYNSESHMIWVSAAGPLLTLILAGLTSWFLMKYGWEKWGYPVLVTAVYSRALAGFFNLINLNDEGRIGHALGVGSFTLSIVVTAVLVYWLVRVNRKYKPSKKFQWATIGLVVLFSSVLILTDQFFHITLWVG